MRRWRRTETDVPPHPKRRRMELSGAHEILQEKLPKEIKIGIVRVPPLDGNQCVLSLDVGRAAAVIKRDPNGEVSASRMDVLLRGMWDDKLVKSSAWTLASETGCAAADPRCCDGIEELGNLQREQGGKVVISWGEGPGQAIIAPIEISKILRLCNKGDDEDATRLPVDISVTLPRLGITLAVGIRGAKAELVWNLHFTQCGIESMSLVQDGTINSL
jgi:hypothetical protein